MQKIIMIYCLALGLSLLAVGMVSGTGCPGADSHEPGIELHATVSGGLEVDDKIWVCAGEPLQIEAYATDWDHRAGPGLWDTVDLSVPLGTGCTGEDSLSCEVTLNAGLYLIDDNPLLDTSLKVQAWDECDDPNSPDEERDGDAYKRFNVIVLGPDLTLTDPINGNEDAPPGAIIPLNDRDENLNCIPDYQDNASRTTPLSTSGFIPVSITFAPVSGTYIDGSDLSIDVTGSVRVWIQDLGDPEGPLYKATSLHWVIGQDTIPYEIFLEGGAPGEVNVTLTLDHHDPELMCMDTVCLTVFSADLDVDSDNTSSTALPDRSYAEECVEDVSGDDQRPGKIIQVDTVDSDRDGVPDFADGFDLNPLLACDDSSASSGFVPIVLELSQFEGIQDATVVLRYSASDPADMEITLDDPFVLPSGALRIWTKDASGVRNKASLLEGGDFVAPDTEYTAEQLGLAGGGAATLYVEAVGSSSLTADMCIVADVYPAPGIEFTDTIRFTAVRQQIFAKNIDEFGFHEVDGFVATGLPQAGTPTEEGYAGAYQLYRMKVTDPRAGFSHIAVNGQQVPIIQAGSTYTTIEDFVGITADDQAVLAADEEYRLTIENAAEEEFTYNADLTPDNAGADPIAWTVADNGVPPSISCAGGILTINSVGGNYTFRTSIADSNFWKPEKETLVDVVFKLVEYDSQGADGGLKVILGDNQNSWEIGIQPNRLVTYPSGVRTESAVFPSAIGDNGNLIDGNFHILRLARNAGAGTATVTLIDSDADVFEFEQVGRGAGSFGIAWGDTGSDIRGHVQIDSVSWTHTDTAQEEVVYSARPSDVVGAYRVLLFNGDDLDVAYNPAWWNPLSWFRKEADAHKILGDLVDKTAQELKTQEWDHVADGHYAVGDDGAFGTEVHKRVAKRLNKSNRWLADVHVRISDKKIMAIGKGTGGTGGIVQVDVIHLEKDYLPRVGDRLDVSKINLYEVKASVSGIVSPTQIEKYRSIVNDDTRIWKCLSKWAYKSSTRQYVPSKRVSQVMKLFTIAGMLGSAFAIIHCAAYDDELSDLLDKMDEVKRETDPLQRTCAGNEAKMMLRNYLSHFVPDQSTLDIIALVSIYKALGDW